MSTVKQVSMVLYERHEKNRWLPTPMLLKERDFFMHMHLSHEQRDSQIMTKASSPLRLRHFLLQSTSLWFSFYIRKLRRLAM